MFLYCMRVSELLTGSQAKQWAFNMLVNFVRQYFIIHKTIAQANHIKVVCDIDLFLDMRVTESTRMS